MEAYKNTKGNCYRYAGRVWISRTGVGRNVCLDTGRDEFMVIAFIPENEISYERIKSIVAARGFRPEHFM